MTQDKRKLVGVLMLLAMFIVPVVSASIYFHTWEPILILVTVTAVVLYLLTMLFFLLPLDYDD